MSTIYLYVKKHSITGLKYFGKTQTTDPYKYLGSGSYWSKHIRKYGTEHVQTLEIWEFENQDECTNFALKFSEENNIVESKEWANLRPENGLDGGCITDEIKQKISKSMVGNKNTKGLKHSEYTKSKMSTSHLQRFCNGATSNFKGKTHSKSVIKEIVDRQKGKVSVINVETLEFERIPSDLFKEFKNVKYVAVNSKSAKQLILSREVRRK